MSSTTTANTENGQPGLRVRMSLYEMEYQYFEQGVIEPVEKLMHAFDSISKLPSSDENSFFKIAGYHGEPFRGPGASGTSLGWWGGFCHHGNVLFPTWHRAYLWRLENALRSVKGCEDVTLPYWDECLAVREICIKMQQEKITELPAWQDIPWEDIPPVIPRLLTMKKFKFQKLQDCEEIPNPLFSYKFVDAVKDKANDEYDYSKDANYCTKRYPLSGLVAPENILWTEDHNKVWSDHDKNTELLNQNVLAWLIGDYPISPDPTDPNTRVPDTYSVYERFKRCLDTPDYNVFSNTESRAYYNKKNGSSDEKRYYDSLESPHNAIHLAVGGIYIPHVYNADKILGANGDMGENDTAAFDPIFFFHHAFIDLVFWLWQRKHKSTEDLKIEQNWDDPGLSSLGFPGVAQGEMINLDTQLYPFNCTSRDVINIEDSKKMGYTYTLSSLEPLLDDIDSPTMKHDFVDRSLILKSDNTRATLRVTGLSRDAISGSFIVETWMHQSTKRSEKKTLIQREPILSRRGIQGCVNCKNHIQLDFVTPVHKTLMAKTANEDISYSVVVKDRSGSEVAKPKLAILDPTVKNAAKWKALN